MIIALEYVRHDGVEYSPNDLIKDIYKEDAERLVNLKVARFLDEVPENETDETDFAKEIDNKFNASELKDIAEELDIEFPGNISKEKLIDLIIEEDKAEEVLEFEVTEEE